MGQLDGHVQRPDLGLGVERRTLFAPVNHPRQDLLPGARHVGHHQDRREGHRGPGLQGQGAPVVNRRQAHVTLEEIGRHLNHPAALGHHLQQRRLLGMVGVEAGQLVPGLVEVVEGERRAARAGRHRLAQNIDHGGDLRAGGSAALAVCAHHIEADHRVADQHADIGAQTLAQIAQIVGHAFPAERHGLFQQPALHVLHRAEQVDGAGAISFANGSQADRTIAHHHRGHAVFR